MELSGDLVTYPESLGSIESYTRISSCVTSSTFGHIYYCFSFSFGYSQSCWLHPQLPRHMLCLWLRSSHVQLHDFLKSAYQYIFIHLYGYHADRCRRPLQTGGKFLRFHLSLPLESLQRPFCDVNLHFPFVF